MARVIWTEPALADLDAIADYIALDNPEAAKALVGNVFRRVEQLTDFPRSGSKPREFKAWRYRQLIERPCRIFYRQEGPRVYILHVLRAERLLRPGVLAKRPQGAKLTANARKLTPILRLTGQQPVVPMPRE